MYSQLGVGNSIAGYAYVVINDNHIPYNLPVTMTPWLLIQPYDMLVFLHTPYECISAEYSESQLLNELLVCWDWERFGESISCHVSCWYVRNGNSPCCDHITNPMPLHINVLRTLVRLRVQGPAVGSCIIPLNSDWCSIASELQFLKEGL